MLLVPKQLRRSGMTGDVPYYGGRFTPEQAHAAAQPRRVAHPSDATQAESLRALGYLHLVGVITPEEYEELRVRVVP